MRRRKFLTDGCRAAIGVCSLPLVLNTRGNQGSVQPKSEPSWETLVAGLEKLIPKLMEDASVPGLSIAIIKDGKLIWRRGFGVTDATSKKPVDNETAFEAASMGKPVFAYAVMKLCEKGVLNLDAPLTKYASGPFLKGDHRLELITARRVLSHTSGFQNWGSDKDPLKIQFTPGERFCYSGEGYSYLQSVVAHLTGQTMDAFMKTNVFVPFGMTSSGYVWNDLFEKRMARPHDDKGKPTANNKATAAHVEKYGAAGELRTTARDYARFVAEVVDPKPADAFRLSKESLKEMLRPQIKLPENEKIDGASAWALGWAIQERGIGNIMVHSGGNDGFRSLTMASPKTRSGFVMLTNGDNGGKVIYDQSLGEALNQLFAG